MTPRLLCLLALTSMASAVHGSTRVDLNHSWYILPESGPYILAQPPTQHVMRARQVDVPHTWNRAGSSYDYLGSMWYFKFFDVPELAWDGIAQLHFGGTFYKSRVFVNGTEVGGHEGGYTEYSFDVSKLLQPGQKNTLAVLIDNRPGMYTIPGFGARGAPDAWYDWWAYGGIVRDVWLELHGPVRIDNQFIRSSIDGAKATVSNRVRLALSSPRELRLRASVYDAEGTLLGGHEQNVSATSLQTEVAFKVQIKGFKLWDLDHPHLQRMRVLILDASDRVLASASQDFGLRTIEIRDRHLLINGRRVRLTGMTRHADSPWEGLAETRGTLLHDWEDMKSLNMTLTRPVHYAPDAAAVEFADRRGILLIPEIPIWQASEQQMSNPAYLALAKAQMRDLIEQYGNHPSVFAWSVLNESAAGTPGGIRFFREMRDYIKSLDPERYVTLADDNLPKLNRAEESAANDADFLMMNQYFGAWHGPREALGPALDKVGRLFPTKMVIISELGFPGIFAKNPDEADRTRVSILREQMPLLEKRDWIAGAILWCYQDYKSRRYFWPGQEGGYLEHGIVDANRQRKPSYFAWRELNEPARLELAWKEPQAGVPTKFELKLIPNEADRMPFYSLDGYRLGWQLTGPENRAFASGGVQMRDGERGTFVFAVPAKERPAQFQLVVKLTRPDGSLAMERVLGSQ